jgi:hypothetical protein
MKIALAAPWTVIACAAIAAAACGKKGPPLAPILHIPAAITEVSATRLGADVYVTFMAPTANVDASFPVDLERVDVYAYTGRTAPPLDRFAELGTRIASVPVTPAPAAAPSNEKITILDTLTSDELIQGPEPMPDRRRQQVPVITPTTEAPGPLRRFYIAIPFSPAGRPGPPGAQADVPLMMVPDPPVAVRATYSPTSVTVTWEPAGGLLGLLLDNPLPPEPAPVDEPPASGNARTAAGESVPPGPTRYNVYRELAPDPLALPAPVSETAGVARPAPMNPLPLTATTVEDDVEFGRERCYIVRAIRGDATTAVVSEPSSRVCVTPVDIFPPTAPTGLIAVPSDGGVSLIWEPNGEPDLGGYLVLRREVGSATLRQLTDSPIPEARFRDSAVTPGVRYLYTVVAVDRQVPLPNRSPQSEPVEEAPR